MCVITLKEGGGREKEGLLTIIVDWNGIVIARSSSSTQGGGCSHGGWDGCREKRERKLRAQEFFGWDAAAQLALAEKA
jgi:hypothetical protein